MTETNSEVKINVRRDRAIINFLCTQPWAIMPSALETIVNIVADHIEGKNVIIEASQESKIVGNINHPEIAVVEITGTIAGDDTILVISKTPGDVANIIAKLESTI